jgi:hypothetical protein
LQINIKKEKKQGKKESWLQLDTTKGNKKKESLL